MSKRLVVCADGTWNRPEEDLETDYPTNVLRVARAVSPLTAAGQPQHVFYDWGVGSYYSQVLGGVTGRGIHKNIMDGYRYIVQNYTPDTEIFLFGFSRGAYTVRSLCGLINNCGILRRPDARLIQRAFNHYKKTGSAYRPDGAESVRFRKEHSHESRRIHFVGAWDTVGSLGVPFSLMGLFDSKDEFYDTKLGSNVDIARHALAIDERREDFEPTLWQPRNGLDLRQVWFAGVHSDVGGSYPPDDQGLLASDHALQWMMQQAVDVGGLELEAHLEESLNPDPRAALHKSRRHVYRLSKPLVRTLSPPGLDTEVHPSVWERWDRDSGYRPVNLRELARQTGR